MLHSKYYKKETNEDPKTSAVFENLMLLPDNVFWHIFRNSCFDAQNLPLQSGKLISYDFWPHWDRTGTDHANYVEPDLFLEFEAFNVIIEAKYDDSNGQYEHQWRQEIKAYGNEYGTEKPFLFIAVGGNNSLRTEKVTVEGRQVPVYKCSWLSLLTSVDKYAKELDNTALPGYDASATRRLLDNIALAFNIHGVYNIKWFDTMRQSRPVISPSSIGHLSNFFKTECS